MRNKIKAPKHTGILAMLHIASFVLLLLVAFIIGGKYMQSRITDHRGTKLIRIDTENRSPENLIAPNSTSLAFFASKNGTKFYSSNCSAGKRVKEENKMYFESAASAERAGYTWASSCDSKEKD